MTRALRDGIAAVHSGELAAARALLEDASIPPADAARAWFWRGLAAPSLSAATDCLRRATQLDPAHGPSRDALARFLLLRAARAEEVNRAEGAELLREATRVAPTLTAAWTALANAAEDREERIGALRRVVALAPEETDVRHRLRDLLLKDAVATATAGDRARALPLFHEAAALDPNDARIWQAILRLAATPADTLAAYRNLTHLAPKNLELWLGLAGAATDPTEVKRAVEKAHALAPNDPRVASWNARLRPAPAPAPTPGRKTVMVVDDSATIRKILSLTLERAGYGVVAEPDGEQAVERLATLVPDLILLDISMPKMDGYEVCKRIRKDKRLAHVPVVMLSGKDGFFDKVKGRMVGASEYLTKPFQPPAVLAVIAAHCENRQASHG